MDTRQKNILMLAVLFVVLLAGFFYFNHIVNGLNKSAPEITLVNSQNKQIKFQIEVVADESSREQGLSSREKLSENAGMLFVFEKEQTLSFWMKDMKFSIDMIFLDSNYNIVDINENAQPCAENEQCPIYNSKKPAKYVLEINSGLAKKNKLKVGDRVIK